MLSRKLTMMAAMMASMSAASASPATYVLRNEPDPEPRPKPKRAPEYRVGKAPRGGSIAQANRWIGKSHEHRREIARRQRQAASR